MVFERGMDMVMWCSFVPSGCSSLVFSSQVKFLLSTQIKNSPPLVPGAGSSRRRENFTTLMQGTLRAAGERRNRSKLSVIISVAP